VNVLKVSLQQSIQVLHGRGWSRRRIARELGIHRKTVASYVGGPKPPISTAGSAGAEAAKAAISTAGSPAGRVSLCREFLPTITVAVTAGLSATRIHQDLVADHGFTGSYESVKRCVRGLVQRLALPYRRLECAPGEEMQVDFGQGAWIEADGKRRRPHLFRAVLSHSRKGYSEVVWRQDTETFIRCCENAFRHFGGVTRTTVVDNLGRDRSHSPC
jgi:transposase